MGNVVVMITHEVSENMKKVLEEVFDKVFVVDPLDSGDLANLTLLDRTELGITFTKLHCWTLIDYTKCVFLDADTLMIQNSDELFDRDEFSAAPDAGWPDCFNSGVFVFRPNLNTFRDLVKHAMTQGSFDGGDQGLLNTFFSSWATKDISKHIPFVYNMVATATYSSLPAYKHFGRSVKIVHFIGATKPWKTCFDGSGNAILGSVEKHTGNHLRLWWQIFTTEVKPVLTKSGQGQAPQTIPGMVSGMGSEYCSSPPPPPVDTRESWEAGRPDYNGTASFSKIIEKMDKTLADPSIGSPKK